MTAWQRCFLVFLLLFRVFVGGSMATAMALPDTAASGAQQMSAHCAEQVAGDLQESSEQFEKIKCFDCCLGVFLPFSAFTFMLPTTALVRPLTQSSLLGSVVNTVSKPPIF